MSYEDTVSKNYVRKTQYAGAKAQAVKVEMGPVTLWFSYDTLIAFETAAFGLVMRQNEWGPTTGQHLNAINADNHGDRLDGDQFRRKLRGAMSAIFGGDNAAIPS